MDKEQIVTYLTQLNDELRAMDVRGELCLYGGTVMCIVFNARPSTKDVDAVFQPSRHIREAARRVAKNNQLREDWLNDAVKDFVVAHPQKILFDFSHLKVYVPQADYLLAMKAMSARIDATDKDDVIFLINKMGLKSADDVFRLIETYYPRQQIRPVTQYFIEELFDL